MYKLKAKFSPKQKVKNDKKSLLTKDIFKAQKGEILKHQKIVRKLHLTRHQEWCVLEFEILGVSD